MAGRPITFGSLFAGIGGFDLGFERAGMVCKWQVEIDEYATKVLAKHWPNVRRHGDIKTFPPSQNDDWRVDVICGGFPCQDISYAGLGAGIHGERSGLFFEAVRVVRQLRPRVVVLENVAALLTRGLDVVLGTLAAIGYDAEWDCIPAAAVGAPHIRDRLFVLAYANERGKSKERIQRSGQQLRTSGNYKKGSPGICADTKGGGREQGSRLRKNKEPRRRRELTRIRQVDGLRKYWSFEPNVGRVANGVSARLDRIRGLGNAVCPPVAEFVGRRVVELLEG